MSQVISRAWLCTAGLEGISWKRAALWCCILWDPSLEGSWSVSKADNSLLASPFGGLPGNHNAFMINFPSPPRLNLFWDNLNLCIFVPTWSNKLNRTSSLPVLIHLKKNKIHPALKKIISRFLCYLLHSAWLKRLVSLSLCLKDRLLILLVVLVVLSHIFRDLSLDSHKHLPHSWFYIYHSCNNFHLLLFNWCFSRCSVFLNFRRWDLFFSFSLEKYIFNRIY